MPEICQEPPTPPPHGRQTHGQKSDKQWSRFLQEKGKLDTFRPYLCSYFSLVCGLSGPISRDTGILSLRYPTHIARDFFFLALSFAQSHLCNSPFCNISCNSCATPPPHTKKTAQKSFCDTLATSIARYEKYRCWAFKCFGFGKRGLLEKGSFQKSPFSRDSREFRDSREPPDCGKQEKIRPFSRDSREFRDFRDSRDSCSEKTPFVMTPFSGPVRVPKRFPKKGTNASFWPVCVIARVGCFSALHQRKTKGGENSGEGKTYHKAPLEKNGFGPPPLMVRFPPPLFTPCHFP